MAFDTLINKPFPEQELLRQISVELQSRFSTYQDVCFFLKIKTNSEKHSHITWVKIFSDIRQLGDFYYDTNFERICAIVKFESGQYDIYFRGAHLGDRIQVSANSIDGSRPILCAIPQTDGTQKMHSRELLALAFGEISQALATKRHKAT